MTMQQRARAAAEQDHEAIMRHLVGIAFPWDYQRSMIDLVFLKSLASPRIAAVVGGNGYLEARPQELYDDTSIMMIELVKHGYSSPRGAQLIARMNQIHGQLHIRQEDCVYVLTSFMFEPIRWNARFGWRRFTEAEKHANHCFWREVGHRMQITAIPEGYEACERYNEDYERQTLRRTRSSVELAAVVVALLERRMPPPVRPLVRPGLLALVDDSLLACFDLPPASPRLRWLVPELLRLRALALRWRPPRRTPAHDADQPLRSSPRGYRVAGPGMPEDWRTSLDRGG
jgi:hypothetical protein